MLILNPGLDPDALPDDDTVYSPMTPVRVHIAGDAMLDEAGKPPDVEIDVEMAEVDVETPTAPAHRGSQLDAVAVVSLAPLSPLSPLSPPAHDHDVRENSSTQQAYTTEQPVHRPAIAPPPSPLDNENGMHPAPPPAYGLWRCSVRADPELLHWRRVDSGHASPLSPGRSWPSSSSSSSSSPTSTSASSTSSATAPSPARPPSYEAATSPAGRPGLIHQPHSAPLLPTHPALSAPPRAVHARSRSRHIGDQAMATDTDEDDAVWPLGGRGSVVHGDERVLGESYERRGSAGLQALTRELLRGEGQNGV